ncbi:MAG: protein phosphatase 2C domain-containing protein [Pseudomonadota bacterium]
MTLTFQDAARTHEGCVRVRNEDRHLERPDAGLWLVADGMGGEAAGDYASETVVRELGSVGRASNMNDLVASTHEGLTRAHRHLLHYAKEAQARVVGSTVVVLLAHERMIHCIWSGDSRLYRMRGGRLAQLSRDHNEVGDLLQRGAITREEAHNWQGRNALTRAVGVYETLETEMLHGDLRPEDTFLLCSDGLTLHVDDEEIREALRHNGSLDGAADALVSLALERGGEDNVTVVIVKASEMDDDGQRTLWQLGRQKS